MPDANNDSFTVKPIAFIRTPFKQKFAIPRQAGLVDIEGVIEFVSGFQAQQAVVGLEQVSHLWLHFIFHKNNHAFSHTQVRPPRLGGNKRLGVLASRASFRPNGLGLSLVKVRAIEQNEQGVRIIVTGVDMLDNTPIIDIKPYLPYADAVADASNLIAPDKPALKLNVQVSDKACQQWQEQGRPASLLASIKQLIALDPRPAYKQQQSGWYVLRFDVFDVAWSCDAKDNACIENIELV